MHAQLELDKLLTVATYRLLSRKPTYFEAFRFSLPREREIRASSFESENHISLPEREERQPARSL